MRFIPILAIALILTSCEKDKFTTKPQIKYKSVNTTVISGNLTLQIKFDITDKEGDFDKFIALRKTVQGCPTSNFLDSLSFSIPKDFLDIKRTQGELVLTLDQIKRGSNSCFLPGGGVRPDTTVYSVYIRDTDGNVSDTAYSDPIIILN